MLQEFKPFLETAKPEEKLNLLMATSAIKPTKRVSKMLSKLEQWDKQTQIGKLNII